MRYWILLVCFAVFAMPFAEAQETQPPIIVISEGMILALNPETGITETLVPAPNAYEEMAEFRGSDITISSADWLSPDGQYLPYSMLFPQGASQTINDDTSFARRWFMLDLLNGGRPEPLVFQDSASAYAMAWSLDGSLLYFLGARADAPSDSQQVLIIVERENWANQQVIILGSIPYAHARSIFATENGVVVMDRGLQSPVYQFTVFSAEGEELNQFEVTWETAPTVNLYVNTPFATLMMDGILRYGLVNMNSGALNYEVDFASGETRESESGYHTVMLSRSAPATSIRLIPGFFNGDSMSLMIYDNANNYLGEIGQVRAYAYGISGDGRGTAFSISPDGQKLVYLEDNVVMLWENGESRSFGFGASILIWGSPMYAPLYDPDYFRG